MTVKNIVLTGFMGTGKTSVGRLLAVRTGRIFVDTDELIVQRAGKPVAAIFSDEGHEAFREMERALARELADQSGLVIATGGRLMLDPENAAALEPGNLVICLQASAHEILSRLAADGVRRPLLEVAEPEQRVRELLEERAEGYGRFPQVSTEGKPVADVATEILSQLPANGSPPAKTAVQPEHLMVAYPGGHYDVIVGSHLLPHLPRLSGIGHSPFVVITDSHVGPLYASRLPQAVCVIEIPAGEQYKTLETVRQLYEQLLDAGIDRKGTVVALGGGVVGDVAGFVAATYMRGIRLVQCPTNVLSMVDSSVGGKTGVDLPRGKNLVGAFKQPAAVIADVSTLHTLPPAEFSAGMAEVIKHGLLAGEALLQTLEATDWRLPAFFQSGTETVQQIIARAIKVKRDVVQADPFEEGQRATLNLGHTFGHAIEQVSQYTVPHGQGVAMGLVAAVTLSANLGYCKPALQVRVEALLQRVHLPTRIPATLDPEALLEAMGRDKKKVAGRLRFVLLRDVGDVFISSDVPETAVIDVVQQLQHS